MIAMTERRIINSRKDIFPEIIHTNNITNSTKNITTNTKHATTPSDIPTLPQTPDRTPSFTNSNNRIIARIIRTKKVRNNHSEKLVKKTLSKNCFINSINLNFV